MKHPFNRTEIRLKMVLIRKRRSRIVAGFAFFVERDEELEKRSSHRFGRTRTKSVLDFKKGLLGI
jgi:hypothetical protein